MAKDEPMIKLGPGDQAPVLSYDVPEPTTYGGRNIIELELADDYFSAEARKTPPPTCRTPLKGVDYETIRSAVVTGMKTGFADPKFFPNVKSTKKSLRFTEKPGAGYTPIGKPNLSPQLAELDPDEVASEMMAGKRLNVYTTLYGTRTYNYVPEPVLRPRLLLIEEYRLSSFLGSYGAGRVIKTFTLLPGEKTKISVKSYTKTETDSKSASSILDSFTQESADSFESAVQNEQSDKESYASSFEYHAEAEAKASWGFGSAKVSGGVKGGTNSAREEFSKNISNSVQKHSAEASAKRDVQINTSFEVKQQTGEETCIERELQNVNLSRTLNFIFRQMNQEFISLLHLVDVRVAFFNGYAEFRKEVTLPELDSLLDQVIVNNQQKRDEVRKAILAQLETILDYGGKRHTFVEEVVIDDKDKYLRIKKNLVSTYMHPVTGTRKDVPGIILGAMTNVLRTEGIIVEALLGQGEALDVYSRGLQDEAVRARTLSNNLLKAEVDRLQTGLKIVTGNDANGAKLFKQVFPPVPDKPQEKEKGTDE